MEVKKLFENSTDGDNGSEILFGYDTMLQSSSASFMEFSGGLMLLGLEYFVLFLSRKGENK